jgi:hypothetical protein
MRRAPQAVVIKGYLRQEGVVDVPPAAVVKSVTAKILQKAVRTIRCKPLKPFPFPSFVPETHHVQQEKAAPDQEPDCPGHPH